MNGAPDGAESVREILGRYGFRFSKSRGQNFLTDRRIPERIAEAAALTAEDGVLEVGPGMGALTGALCDRAGRVVALELDAALIPILAETMAGRGNLTVLQGDLLKTDLSALVKERFSGFRAVACANLPYNITTPAVAALLSCRCFDRILVMVQREVARRICAAPGTPDYGAFSVFCRHYAGAEILFEVSSGAFVPRPKVESAVVRFSPRAPLAAGADEAYLFRVVRAAFGQRRKTLANALTAGLSRSKEDVAECLSDLGYAPDIRGETLSYEEFSALAGRLRGRP